MSAFEWNFKAGGANEAAALFAVLQKLDAVLTALTVNKQRASTEDRKATQATREATQAHRDAGKAAKEQATAQERLKNTVVNTHTSTVKLKNGLETTKVEYNALGDVVKKTITTHEKQHGVIRRTTRVMDEHGNVLKTVGNQTVDTEKKQQSFFSKIVSWAGIWNTLNKAFDFGVKRLQQIGGFFTENIAKIRDVGISYESTVIAVKNYVEGADNVIAKSKEISKEFGVSQKDVMLSAVELGKAGLAEKDILDTLPASLKAAGANGIEVARAGEIAAASLSQFSKEAALSGDKALTGSKALAILTSAANASASDINGLAWANSTGAATANALGWSIKDVSTALSLMSNNALKGTAAGTALNSALSRLSKPPKQVKEALAEMGLTVEEVQSTLTKPTEMIKLFGDTFAKVPDKVKKLELMKKVLGEVGAKGFMPIFEGGTEKWDEMVQKIDAGMGAIDSQSKATQESLGGVFKKYITAIGEIYTAASKILAIPLTKYYESVGNIVKAVQERLDKLGESFKGKSLEDWINTVRNIGFSGLFEGLSAEIQPELERLKELFTVAWEFITTFIADAWNNLWSSGMLDESVEAMRNIGVQIGEAIVEGMTTALNNTDAGKMTSGIKNTFSKIGQAGKWLYEHVPIFHPTRLGQKVVDKRTTAAQTEEVQTLRSHLGDLAKSRQGTTDPAKLQRIQAEEDKTFAELMKLDPAYRRTEQKAPGDAAKAYLNTDAGKQIRADITRKAEEINERNKPLGNQQGMQQQLAGLYAQQETATGDARKKIDDQILAAEYKYKQENGTYSPTHTARVKAGTYKGLDPETEMVWQENQRKKQAAADQARREAEQRAADEAAAAGAGMSVKAYKKMQAVGKSKAPTEADQELDEGQRKAFEDKKKELSGAVQTRQEELGLQQQLVDGEKAYAERLFESATIMDKLKVQLNDAGAAFQKWLIAPVNVFLEKISQIKEKWGDLKEGLSAKSIDVGEKFGLTQKPEADKQRKELLAAGLQRDEKLLGLAQTPEEKMRLQEKMAGRYEKMAELSTGDEQKSLAKKAQEALKGAEGEAAKAEENDLKRVEIEKENLQKNIVEWEGMMKKGGSAGQRAAVLEQLQGAYQQFGDVEKATKAQEDLKRARVEEAKEAAETAKMTLESMKLQNDLTKQILEALRGARSGALPIPESDAFATPEPAA